jgi:hypothetical protein
VTHSCLSRLPLATQLHAPLLLQLLLVAVLQLLQLLLGPLGPQLRHVLLLVRPHQQHWRPTPALHPHELGL